MRNGKLFPSTCDANSWNISHNSQHLRFSSQSTQHESSSFRAAREATSPTRRGEWGAGWDEQTSTSVNFIQLFFYTFQLTQLLAPSHCSCLVVDFFRLRFSSFSPIHSHFLCAVFLAHTESSQVLVYESLFVSLRSIIYSLSKNKRRKQMKMS